MPPKLDDAPWKDEDPVDRERRWARQRLSLSQFGGGSTQLVKCPECLCLLEEGDTPQHLSLAHPEVTGS
jgi:hypothetical protein